MKNGKVFIFCSLVIALLLGTSSLAAQSDTPVTLNIGFSVWVGYGPLFIAKDQGYFADEGLDVTLTDVENPADRFAAMAAGKLDGLVTTLDTEAQYCNPETPFKTIFALDTSSGGDGIVSKPEITTVADLKGKKVGVRIGSVSQFLLENVLESNGMTDKDLTIVNMGQGDVPAALASGQIDAGVTWSPNLGKAVQNGALLLMDSKSTPGLIVDIAVVRQDVIDQHPEVPAGLLNAWYKALDYLKANPEDGAAIMAKGLGGFYESAADIDADLAGVTLYDQALNQTFFTGDGAGTAIGTLTSASEFYGTLNMITNPCDASTVIDSSYVLPEGAATMEAPMATMEATASS